MLTNPLRDFVQALECAEGTFTVDQWLEQRSKVMAKEFTAKQLKDYQAYERVRDRGLYNMFSNEAREATRLTKDEYTFVMLNYSELADAVELQASRS